MISGNLEAKLWAGALFGGIALFVFALFVLLPRAAPAFAAYVK